VARTGPNIALEPTAPMVALWYAAVRPWRGGSPLALDLKTKMQYNSPLQFYARLTFC